MKTRNIAARKSLRIALLIGQDAGFFRDLLRGIRSYALEKRDWTFQVGPPESAAIAAFRRWNPHGIISQLISPELAAEAIKLQKPLVDISYSVPGLAVPAVDVDHEMVGRLAAEHFLERGYRNFAFFGSEWACYSKLREASYRSHLAKAGYSVATCYVECILRLPALIEWKRATQRIERWLRDLPKPVAIFAPNDRPARDIADICMRLGIKVPDEVALLGVDNDDLDCALTPPSLSSIATPARQIGYEAMKLLDGLMRGKVAGSEPVFLPPSGVVVRQSTDIHAIDDAAVAAAISFIRERYSEALRVDDVAQHVAISRRMLEYKFRDLVGHSILEEIRRQRIHRVENLLADTDLPMPAIARCAGFSTPQRMAVVFHAQTGFTPTQYRRQTRNKN